MKTRYWSVEVSEGETNPKKRTQYLADVGGLDRKKLTEEEQKRVLSKLGSTGLGLDDEGDAVIEAILNTVAGELFIGDWTHVDVSAAVGVARSLDTEGAAITHAGIDFRRVVAGIK